MGIYIRNIDIPEIKRGVAAIINIDDILFLKTADDIVLVPDHGDLIDRDVLIRDTEKRCCADCDKRKGRKKNGKYGFIYEIGEAPCRACGVDDMVGELEDAKVIIPAERSECGET